MTYTIRTLRADEVPLWLDFMCHEIFPDDPREAVESMWTEDPIKDVTGIFIAESTDGRIIASVKAACRDLSFGGTAVRTAIISGVGVRNDFRGQGVIRRLFAACDAEMIARGAQIAHLYSNPDTREFYLHMGYLHPARRPGEDYYRMFRLLAPVSVNGTEIRSTLDLLSLL